MRKLNIPFNEQRNELKKKLADSGIIEVKVVNGKQIFSFKSGKKAANGQRPALTRFNKSVCEQLIEN